MSIYYAPKPEVKMEVGDLVRDRWGRIGVLVKFVGSIEWDEARWIVQWTNGKRYGANQNTLELISAGR